MSLAQIEPFFQDFTHALRSLRRRPGIALAAGLSLALGIGFTVTIFTMLNAVTLRPLPYADADRLVWLTQVLKKNSTDELTFTPHFLEWRRQNRSFTDLAGYNYQTRNLTGRDEPAELHTAKASASLLPMLGVQPALGRNFLKDEDYKGRDQVALLTDGLWRDRFGADPKIVGRSITLDGAPFIVVGVLPPGFVFPGEEQVQLITPLGKDQAAELQLKSVSITRNIVGRLRPGITLDQAHAELTVIQSHLPVPPFKPVITIKMLPLREYLFGSVKTAGLVLIAAAAFLLLIACANVSNLLLTRWMQRDRELAIRAALGGSRWRLTSQLLIESAVLGGLACAAGVLLAYWARGPVLALSPYHPSGLSELPFDGRVLGFGIALGLFTTLLFGLLPALRATNIELSGAMKTGEAAVVGGRGALRVLSLIAGAEIATTLILTAGAGLMLQSFWNIRYKNLGFQPDRLVAATLNLSGSPYRDPGRRSAFARELLERAGSLPGVDAAAIATVSEIPPGEGHATNTFAIEGRNQPLGGARPIGRYPVVSPSYFAMLGIPLVHGRLLAESDGANTPPVVVVNQALVRRYFPDENPLGKRIRTGPDGEPWRTIAGIAGDVKTSGLAAAPEPTIYLPYSQAGSSTGMAVILRSALSPAVIATEFRKAVAEMDPAQPVATIRSMNDRLSASVSGPRFTALLLFGFAALAIVLGLIGVYGVMGCRVRWQLRELAVRQALGAQQPDVIRHVLSQGAAIIVPGVFLGLVGAISLGRLLASMLYEVSPHDPLTLLAVSAGLAGIALLACLAPAMRAARTDPLELLRHE